MHELPHPPARFLRRRPDDAARNRRRLCRERLRSRFAAEDGAGFLPLALGIILALLGIVIAGSAAASGGEDDEHTIPVRAEWRGWLCIVAGPLLFVVLGHYGGLVPATSPASSSRPSATAARQLRSSLTLAAGITLLGVVLFAYVLGVAVSRLALGSVMIESALTDLWFGFGVALEPHNLLWCVVGVVVGNIVGVLPGMGVLATVSILLPPDLRHGRRRRRADAGRRILTARNMAVPSAPSS